jgi:hypothetical protein
VLDPVVPRVTVFSARGRPLFDVRLGKLGYRAFDLQVVGRSVFVAVQDRSFHGRLLEFDLNGSRERSLRVMYEGDPTGIYGRVDVVDDRMFHATLTGPLEDEEVFVELVPRGDRVEAKEVSGWPIGDGVLEYPESALDATIPLRESGSQGWSKDIRFRFSMKVNGRRITPTGVVSWGDMEIDPAGAIHFLLFAGTYNKAAQDGLWYLKVSPEGEVGRPIKLADPERDDGGQTSRRLTLSATGEPFAMWTDRRGLTVESLKPLEAASLPGD